MKRVLNFGSINVDHVYSVDHFGLPEETIRCQEYRRFAGGKGLNQSIALAQAGACVTHAGKVGVADTWLKTLMEDKGVDTTGTGDTFIGFFLAEFIKTGDPKAALATATHAAAICVTRHSAADSIPSRREIEEFHNRS